MKKILFVLTIALFTNIIRAGIGNLFTKDPFGAKGKGEKCEPKGKDIFKQIGATRNFCETGLHCKDGICR